MIQTVIQHDPRRADLLEPLLARLPANSRVVVDPGASEPRRNPWRCYRACLQALEPEATHLLIVQDDVTVCRDFPEILELIVERQPDDPLCLFLPGIGVHRRVMMEACAQNKRFTQLTAQNFIPTVGMVWPRWAVESILAYSNEYPFDASKTADDSNLWVWASQTRPRILATVPSLVEHEDREPSLVGKLAMGGRNPSRIAACWLGEELSPLTLDW